MTDPAPPGAVEAAASPLVASILEGTAPPQVKAAAARGALPLSRAELLRVLVALRQDPDPGIQGAATAQLDDWPAEEAARLVAEPSTPPEVLGFFLTWAELDQELLTSLTANESTPVEALESAARSYPADLLDVLLLNHTRLIASPAILDAIESNPSVTALQQTRIAEIRHHFLRPAAPPPPEAPHEPPAAPAEAASEPPTAAPAPPQAAESAPEATDGTEETGAGGEPGLQENEGAYQRILGLNVTQKIALAARGDREERLILIRDANRSVQVAVIASPKITESEVEAISKMRNVKDEILRRISTRRDWMKNMQIVRGLASNPKTPLPVSLTLLKRLMPQDLKTMISDRNLPDTLRRMAKKSLDQKLNRR